MIKIKTSGLRALAIMVALVALSVVVSARALGGGGTLVELERWKAHVTDADEPEEARQKRLREIAAAIDSVAKTREERALLLAIGHHESHFARAVCSGEKLGDRGRAYGCFQSHEKDRSGGIQGQAERAIIHLRRGANYCSGRGFDRVRGAVSLYARGGCNWRGADERVATVRDVERRL